MANTVFDLVLLTVVLAFVAWSFRARRRFPSAQQGTDGTYIGGDTSMPMDGGHGGGSCDSGGHGSGDAGSCDGGGGHG